MEQVAYLMADVGNVQSGEIKDIYENLEGLSSRIRTRVLY
jgi:D-3-phosphoglycerate dehydrogenase